MIPHPGTIRRRRNWPGNEAWRGSGSTWLRARRRKAPQLSVGLQFIPLFSRGARHRFITRTESWQFRMLLQGHIVADGYGLALDHASDVRRVRAAVQRQQTVKDYGIRLRAALMVAHILQDRQSVV